MKRLNNKGFAISTLLYGSIVIIFLIVIALMSILGTTRKNTKNLSYVIEDELNRYSAVNQDFEYDEAIDKYGREIFILEDGWYMINLWDTKLKFVGEAYFKKDEKINVYLKDKDDEEVSYITFPSKEVSETIDQYPTIKHFNAVKYKTETRSRSKFSIEKISDNDSNNNPLPAQTSKLNNVKKIRDCSTENTENKWMIWTEIRIFDDKNNDITNNISSITFTDNTKNNGSYQSKITDNEMYKQDSGEYYGIHNNSGNSEKCIYITLNNTYNLSEIAIWHYHDDFRTFKNHKLGVAGASGGYTNIIENMDKRETLLGIRYADRYKIN